MDTLEKITGELREGRLQQSPHLCAEYRAQLSGEYSFWAGQLEQILRQKPALWNTWRKDFKSDAACEKWWQATEDGINEMGISLKLKRIDKLMSGLNGLIRMAENEAKNNF